MTVPEELYQRGLDEGFTLEAICSLLANIQGESAFRCDNAEDRINRVVSDAEYIRRADAGEVTYNGKNFIYDEVGFGYAQWTYWSRKKYLLEFCKGLGVSVADSYAQKEFIFVEMKRDFPGVYQLCKTSHDIDELMNKLVKVWEYPADHNAALRERIPYARAWYAKYSNWTPPVETVEEPAANQNAEPVDNQTNDEGLMVEKHWPPRTIQKGLNWPEVYYLQSLLRLHGYNVLISGVFADSLDRKVREYQAANNLKVDGVVGPKTWKSLMKLPITF